MADEVQLRFNRRSGVVGLSGLAGAVAIGVAMMIVGHGGSVVAGTIIVVVGGPLLIPWAVIAVRPPPALILSESGLRAPSAGILSRRSWRQTPIPWNEISAIVVFTYSNGALPGLRNIGFVPTDPTSDMWRRHRGRRLNQVLTGFPIVMPVALLPVSPDELLDLLHRFDPSITMSDGGTRSALPGPLSWYPRPR